MLPSCPALTSSLADHVFCLQVMKGQSYNEKVDVFSFAIIMYELLTSRAAMAAIVTQGDLDYAAVHAHAEETANGFRLPIPVEWPAPVRELIEDCWAQRSSKRPSFAAIEQQLGKLRVSHPMTRDDILGDAVQPLVTAERVLYQIAHMALSDLRQPGRPFRLGELVSD